MTNIEDVMITREDSFILFQLKAIPVLPAVWKECTGQKHLDYRLMHKSLDGALEWTYRDLIDQREYLINTGQYIPEEPFLGPLQTVDGESTTDIEVINRFFEEGEHIYFEVKGNSIYPNENVKRFPLRGLDIRHVGIYFFQTPIIVYNDQRSIFEQDVKGAGKEELLSEPIRIAYEITYKNGRYNIPRTWYTKAADGVVRLFGKNFAVIYSNLKIQENKISQ